MCTCWGLTTLKSLPSSFPHPTCAFGPVAVLARRATYWMGFWWATTVCSRGWTKYQKPWFLCSSWTQEISALGYRSTSCFTRSNGNGQSCTGTAPCHQPQPILAVHCSAYVVCLAVSHLLTALPCLTKTNMPNFAHLCSLLALIFELFRAIVCVRVSRSINPQNWNKERKQLNFIPFNSNSISSAIKISYQIKLWPMEKRACECVRACNFFLFMLSHHSITLTQPQE